MTSDDIQGKITPGTLVYGRELPSMNIILQFHPGDSLDETYTTDTDHLREAFAKVRKANKKLMEVYHQEFITKLITQATNKRDRYKFVPHKQLSVCDYYCSPNRS